MGKFVVVDRKDRRSGHLGSAKNQVLTVTDPVSTPILTFWHGILDEAEYVEYLTDDDLIMCESWLFLESARDGPVSGYFSRLGELGGRSQCERVLPLLLDAG